MNEKVQQLIEKKIKEQEQAKLQLEEAKKARRDCHLVALGLHGDKQEKIWTTHRVSQSQYYSPQREMFYSLGYPPIEVTDEEYAELCKYYPENGDFGKEESVIENTASEKTLKAVAGIVLGLGIVFSLILVIVAFSFDMGILALLAIPCLLSILSTWALYRCITNMSFTLRQIDQKLKDSATKHQEA